MNALAAIDPRSDVTSPNLLDEAVSAERSEDVTRTSARDLFRKSYANLTNVVDYSFKDYKSGFFVHDPGRAPNPLTYGYIVGLIEDTGITVELQRTLVSSKNWQIDDASTAYWLFSNGRIWYFLGDRSIGRNWEEILARYESVSVAQWNTVSTSFEGELQRDSQTEWGLILNTLVNEEQIYHTIEQISQKSGLSSERVRRILKGREEVREALVRDQQGRRLYGLRERASIITEWLVWVKIAFGA